jgi:N-acylneuraminate cytidylyltransferase
VIPARGGSKSIPRKNLAPLGGRPLLAWSIRAGFRAAQITDVVVSTEDGEISRVAERELRREAAAEEARLADARVAARYSGQAPPMGHAWRVVDRPPELATDEAPTDPVLIHALEVAAPDADLVVLLQPTNPFRPPWLIDMCIDRLLCRGLDAVFTAARGHFGWLWRDGWVCTAPRRPRRQDMTPEEVLFLEDGSVYVVRAEVLRRTGARLAGRLEPVEIDHRDLVDIDVPDDLDRAASLYEKRWRAAEEAA